MGYITESRDPAILAEMVEKLITEPGLRKRISRYNHAYAMEHFSASKVARRMEMIYQDVMYRTGHQPVSGSPQGRWEVARSYAVGASGKGGSATCS